ncbi:DUF2786 domain-containing protein [Modestobacter sp. I12A-02628]|uniref:DUF2786 domain-containing protein n=1 Tax=Goekera deserti TaxID=2497753 RepID=A0A7K3WDE8_9ACTN|nr:DUF2786 domain-containing protein [Goekera deserti]MPQ98373.1 DUF2786 domain-containing protein [Goekera deserti]NDI48200.1 DUF2786 domain-containing protein [Goekera deserti]NEL53949.1 DUF2786 domain-containing protein [Goekera deserti]
MPTRAQRPSADPVVLLLAAGLQAARSPDGGRELDEVADELGRRAPQTDVTGAGLHALTTQLAVLWEHGWQPADVVHLAGRRVNRRAARLVAVGITAEAAASGAATRAPAAWVEQLDGCATTSSVGQWQRSEGLDAATGWRDLIRLVAALLALPGTEPLLPPPSAWPAARRDAAVRTAPVAERALNRIRGLLAKAESTDFPEEADALTAKAQELMSRHAIDAAVLADAQPAGGAGTAVARRLHLADPYAEPKAHLLHAVADANGARVVLYRELGIATVVGLPADLELVSLLFTSLLLQATRALTDATRHGGTATRSAAFRRGFLLAYAARVGERLERAREEAATAATHAYGADLVPVLARRAEEVDRATDALFPRVARRRSRSVDAAGWHAGRLAAERADLGDGPGSVTAS